MSVFDSIQLFQNTISPTLPNHKEKITQLITLLSDIGDNDHYDKIDNAIQMTTELRSQIPANLSNTLDQLKTIIEDLEAIKIAREKYLQEANTDRETALRQKFTEWFTKHKFTMRQYLQYPFKQGFDFRNGKGFIGMCYGYGHEYTKMRFNPTQNFATTFQGLHLTRAVYEAQKNHGVEALDSKEIQSTRFDYPELVLNPKECGNVIASLIQQSPDKELSVTMKDVLSTDGGHNIRMSFSKTGQVTFFDSNFGVFVLPTMEIFKAFFNEHILFSFLEYARDYNRFKLNVLTPANSAQDEQKLSACYACWLVCLVGSQYLDLSCGECCLDLIHSCKASCGDNVKKRYGVERNETPTPLCCFGSFFNESDKKPAPQQTQENPLSRDPRSVTATMY